MAAINFDSDSLPVGPYVVPGVLLETDTVTVTVVAAATTVDLSGWTFSNWTPGAPDNDRVVIDGSSLAVALDLTGTIQIDTIIGGSAGDTIDGGSGADTLDGGSGDDFITYDGSDISVGGGANTDTLVVKGAATIDLSAVDQSSGDTANVTGFEDVDASGSVAAVSLTGDGGANVLIGGSAGDTIDGGGGADTLAGGAGDDTITHDGSDVSIDGGDDNDTLKVTGAATVDLSAVDQSSGDTAVVTGFENVDASGSAAAVDLTGDGSANVLTGGSAGDTIDGGGGADTIDGGGGADTLAGGAGDDAITYDGSDVSIDGGDDNDTLKVTGAATVDLSAVADQTSGDTAVVTGFENVDESGSAAAVDLTGDGSANVLTGGSAGDTIAGGGG
ncbi:MAG: calcium-binding protein, partial [Hyphomicrobiales bacterium]|nr:calcium-binding protein [Hyphomicrobiales bacterium]